MSVKTRKSQPTPKPATLPKNNNDAAVVTDGPVLTPEVIAALRAAGNLEAGLKILLPDAPPRPKVDATYALNPSVLNARPLPQRRGICLKVAVAAVTLNRPFTVADITAALPAVKSAGYWTRRLAKDGFFSEVAR